MNQFQTTYIRTYCYQRNHSKQILQTTARKNHCKQYLQTIIRESFQTILWNYCHKNYSKQFLHTITRGIIANYAYKSLSDDSGHFKNTSYLQHIIQTILLKLLSENSLQTMLSILIWILQQVKPRVTLLIKTQLLGLITIITKMSVTMGSIVGFWSNITNSSRKNM